MMKWLGVIVSLMAVSAAAADTPAFSPRVQSLLLQLTLDEKINLTIGTRDPSYHGQSGYTPGVPRLGIPPLRWGNGPSGLENAFETTAVPPPTAVAASFDVQLARRLGDLIGLEARHTGVDVINGPDVGITRLPNAGGGGFSEDPYLGGQMAAAVVRGIQSHGVMATAKHFIAYVQSLHAGAGGSESYNFIVDDRTLHEIYLPPFEAAMNAGVASIMAAYSKVNGAYNVENEQTLIGILRDELGWQGWVNADWHANRSVTSITRGLDVEMPGYGPGEAEGAAPFWGPGLKAAAERDQVTRTALDCAVGRLLTQMERFGIFDRTREPSAALDVEGDAAISRALATEGAVLLKNDGDLPLASAALANLVLIGPTANQLAVGSGGNRGFGLAERKIGPLDALRAGTGTQAQISYAVGGRLTGSAVPASALNPDGATGAGLARISEDGSPTVVDPSVDFVGAHALPKGKVYVWRGRLSVAEAGQYTLQTQSWGGSTVLRVDGRQRATSARLPFGHGVPRQWTSLLPTTDNLDNGQVTLQLQAGQSYQIEIEGRGEPLMPFQVRFAWITPQMRRDDFAEAVAAAKKAHTAVIFAWSGAGGAQAANEQGAVLPAGQNELIEAVVAANPNTIVVLNTGAGVSMPWRNKVRAILQMWYPGQEGGWVTADLLLGKTSPSGKLPVTVPIKLADTGALQPDHPERYDGDPVRKEVVFSEGILVGYRWFDQQDVEPLYPFGYGLSYTTFAYSGLKTRTVRNTTEVTFTIKNTGRMQGAEVAQVYLGPPPDPDVPMAPKALVAFERIDLAPGQSRTVVLRVDARQMSYWDVGKKIWRIAGGKRPVYVGASSRDLKLSGAINVSARP